MTLEEELAALTDDICLRDHSARVRRVALRRLLNQPTPNEAEIAAEHQRMMDANMRSQAELAKEQK